MDSREGLESYGEPIVADTDNHTVSDLSPVEEHGTQGGSKGGSNQNALTTTLSKIADKFNSATPAVSNVAVTNSENVQFGNNTYFNGPVVIKQIIQSNSGQHNEAYTKTESEHLQNSAQHPTKPSKCEPSIPSGFHFKTWHKIVIVMGSIVTVSVACSLAFIGSDTDSTTHSTMATSKGPNESLIIAKFHLRVVSRTDWLAEPPTGVLDPLKTPVPWVIIAHTATESCYSQSECVLRTRLIQTFHIESRKWFDIGYNFLVGGDGSMYYGRGWDAEGAHTKGYNKFSIGIAFIGAFNTEEPTVQQLEACQKLLQIGVELGKLDKDYKLLAHRQLWATSSPGDKLFDIIKEWPHFVHNSTGLTEKLRVS